MYSVIFTNNFVHCYRVYILHFCKRLTFLVPNIETLIVIKDISVGMIVNAVFESG